MHTKRASSEKLPPLAYWASPGRFNLTALLQTGRFYLDETGLLVAPNGTRYRIPSGPPEGRKPLRPDRPTGSRSDVITQKGDLFFSEQQDSSKLGHWSLTKSPKLPENSNRFDGISSGKLTLATWNHTKANSEKSELLEAGSRLASTAINTTQLDWNVILLTVILSSIALVCNLALVIFFAWKINRSRVTPRTHGKSASSQKGHSNPMIHFPSNLDESDKQDQCHCLRNRVSSYTDPTKLTASGYGFRSSTFTDHMHVPDRHSFHTRLSRRYRHRRGRRRRPMASRRQHPSYQERDPLVDRNSLHHGDIKSRVLRNDSSLIGDLGQVAPFLNPVDRVELGSSSGGSWHVVVSDGMVSETTADEEEDCDGNTTNGDSGTNSDIYCRKLHSANYHRVSADRRRFLRSDSTPDDIGRLNELRLMMGGLNGRRIMQMDSERRRLDTIKSGGPPQSDGSTCSSNSELQSSMGREQPPAQFPFDLNTVGTIHVCHSLGIHFGLLGVVLSLLQLVVVCTALSRRMLDPSASNVPVTPRTESYLSELTCVMATSLAADTLLCARQYVLGAILLVFWISCYFTISGSNPRVSVQKTTNSICLRKHNGFAEGELRNRSLEINRRQQRYAYLALTHSLPWAVAAGTALLITFGLSSNVEGVVSHRGQIKLNLFFHGLHSLLICPIDQRYNSRTVTETPHLIMTKNKAGFETGNSTTRTNNKDTSVGSNHSLSWSLLILIPLCIHVLLCLIYAIVIRLGMQRPREVKYETQNAIVTGRIVFCVSGMLLALISLEYLSCAVPVVWSMFTFTHTGLGNTEEARPTLYVYRLVLLHLLIDPWLVAFLIRPIMEQMIIHLNRSNDADRTLRSELVLRPWSNRSRARTLPRNEINHSDEMHSSGRPASSSVGLMSCLPLVSRISTAESPALTVPANGQTMLMPCVPSTNFYVSPIQTLPHSTGLDTNLFVPLNDRAVRLTPSQSDALTMGHSHPNQSTLPLPLNFANPVQSVALGTITSGQSSSPSGFNPDIFPQLCEHHQKLLEEHYFVRLSGPDDPPTSSSTEAVIDASNSSSKITTTSLCTGQRVFGQVPRLNPASLKCHDSLLVKPVIRLPPDDLRKATVSVSEPDAGSHLLHQNYPMTEGQSPSSDDPGKFIPGRTPGGQSQATAAVMAAAAAAVAAQAGTMTRSNVDHTGIETPNSTISQLSCSPQPFQQNLMNELKTPLFHSSLSATVPLEPNNNSLQRITATTTTITPTNKLTPRD
ncbi:hypothetical protein FBUS_01301 [Fasciolopsis buskii]|uniref:Uncharacterized protein n=1 Tax=Fasciolopsis buskii TaxID=27845 RepID=A0A8E0S4T5_9TREM|nr:hypothetical protein FBUS_01301 [Fasciolopsis buski]